MTEDYDLTMEVKTFVTPEDLKPWVVVQLNAIDRDGREFILSAFKLPPEEARAEGRTLIEAAEAAEVSANLVLAMREQKVDESLIQTVLNRMRERRGRS